MRTIPRQLWWLCAAGVPFFCLVVVAVIVDGLGAIAFSPNRLPEDLSVDYVVVLGCWVHRNGTLGDPFLRRVQLGVQLCGGMGERCRKGILFTGAMNEAQKAKAYAMTLGLPEVRGFTEDLSQTTYENALFANHVVRLIAEDDAAAEAMAAAVVAQEAAEEEEVGEGKPPSPQSHKNTKKLHKDAMRPLSRDALTAPVVVYEGPVIVVSDTYHVLRGGLLFRSFFSRCYFATSQSRPFHRAWGSVREAGAVAKNLWLRRYSVGAWLEHCWWAVKVALWGQAAAMA